MFCCCLQTVLLTADRAADFPSSYEMLKREDGRGPVAVGSQNPQRTATVRNALYEYRHRIVSTWHLGSAHRLHFTSQHRILECPLFRTLEH